MSTPPRAAPAGPQSATPYADAVRAYDGGDFVRLDVPGHGGDAVAQPELAALLGERVLGLDLPPLVSGIDQGPRPTPLQRSAQLAAEAWGAHRTWLLTNGGSKGNLVACLALRHLGEHVVVQRSVHSSVMDGMVLGGLHGHFVTPEVDAELGAAHGLRPEALARALDEHPAAAAAYVVSPSYFGAVADVRALGGGRAPARRHPRGGRGVGSALRLPPRSAGARTRPWRAIWSFPARTSLEGA